MIPTLFNISLSLFTLALHINLSPSSILNYIYIFVIRTTENILSYISKKLKTDANINNIGNEWENDTPNTYDASIFPITSSNGVPVICIIYKKLNVNGNDTLEKLLYIIYIYKLHWTKH